MGPKAAGLIAILQEYSEETGAHGISRVGDHRRKLVARIFWAILFLVATGFFVYQSQLLVRKFLTYPKNVETRLEYKVLPFPAVTICNANPFVRSRLPNNSYVSTYQETIAKLSDGTASSSDVTTMCNSSLASRVVCDGSSFDLCSSSNGTDEQCQIGQFDQQNNVFIHHEEEGYPDASGSGYLDSSGSGYPADYHPDPSGSGFPDPDGSGSPDPNDSGSPDPDGSGSPDPDGSGSPDPDGSGSPDPDGSGSSDPNGSGSPDPNGSGSSDPDGSGSSDPNGSGSPDPDGSGSPDPDGSGSSDPNGSGSSDPNGSGSPDPNGSGSPDPNGSGSPDPNGSNSPDPNGSGSPNPNGSDNPDPDGSDNPDPDGSGSPDPDGSGSSDPNGSGSPDPNGSGSPDPNGSGSPDPNGSGSPGPNGSDNPMRRKREATTLNNAGTTAQVSSKLQILSKARKDMTFLLVSDNISYEAAMVGYNDFILECSYNLAVCNNKSWQRIWSNAFGRCWTFNMNGSEQHSTRPGPDHGLRLIIDVNQMEYMDLVDTAGVRVTIHNPKIHPFPEVLGYNAKTTSRTSIGLTAFKTTRLSRPWGNCTDNHLSLEDIDYIYEGHYTIQGCFYSYLQTMIINKCGCAHYWYPLPRDSRIQYCKNITSRKCVDDEEERLAVAGDLEPENCGCYKPCEEREFKSTISLMQYPRLGSQNSESELQVEVYYERLDFQTFIEYKEYDWTQLISDIGGLIGLWIGFSLLSLAEIMSLLATVLLYCCGCTKGDIEKKRNVIASKKSIMRSVSQPEIAIQPV